MEVNSSENLIPGQSCPLGRHAAASTADTLDELDALSDVELTEYPVSVLTDPHVQGGLADVNIGSNIAQARGVSNADTSMKTRIWYGPNGRKSVNTASYSDIFSLW